jgi:hypothetical protein
MVQIELTTEQAQELMKILDHYKRECLNKMFVSQTRETERALQEEAKIADRLKNIVEKGALSE